MKFDVILADPPWHYREWIPSHGDNSRSAESHYPTMTDEDIALLSVDNLAADNCALFLWTVWPKLAETWNVIEEWGFIYKTIAWVWVKAKRSGFGHFTGMGYYTRANTEPCLLAIKGQMPVTSHDVLALIYSPVREHSRKPDEQYAKIERLYPEKKYLELFARKKRKGWDSWGNEVESDINLTSLAVDVLDNQ